MRHGPVHALHDRLELVAMVEAKRLGDRPHLLVGADQRLAIRPVAGHPRGELAAVLHVQEHPRDQPRDAVDISGDRRQLGDGAARGVEYGRDAALVVEFTHGPGFPLSNSPRPGRGGGEEETPWQAKSRVPLGPPAVRIIMSTKSTYNLHQSRARRFAPNRIVTRSLKRLLTSL